MIVLSLLLAVLIGLSLGIMGTAKEAGEEVEPHRRDGVDAPEHQPEQRELEELRHRPADPRYAAWTASSAPALGPP